MAVQRVEYIVFRTAERGVADGPDVQAGQSLLNLSKGISPFLLRLSLRQLKRIGQPEPARSAVGR